MRIYLDSIGCRLNQSEIESYARQFRAAGHTLVPSASDADLAVINTCTVTNAADSDSRAKIRQVVRAGVDQVVVTGCWSTLNPENAGKIIGVSKVISNLEKNNLVPTVLDIPAEHFDLEPVARELIPGARLRTRAFIKVQDGCDNRCTFCVTTVARGPGKSRSTPEIIADIQAALSTNGDLDTGAKEIVLTGVHLGSWGQDFPNPKSLHDLVRTILKETDIPRLRLSSLEPWDLNEDFFSLWEDPRLCRHLHLPLQSGSGSVLRRMARNTTPQSFAELVSAARAASPEIAVTTDLIAGFPGETKKEFLETVEYIQELYFSGGHVFTYSPRPGTAASLMPDQVPFPLRKERNAELRKILADNAQSYQGQFINQTLPVLWESVSELDPENWSLRGLTDNYLRVNSQAPANFWNQISSVLITGFGDHALEGEIQAFQTSKHESKLHILPDR
jgi:threonylcarbamoyladenosine tRNA methylthiotransferase MtaB